ncbi:sugar nucleotide-binding protein [Mesonia sp. K7]|uniref:sugar nucleotide-binding protein n=1 Tax=Mesonia sp. K7 TaxID=2218606 RepID=UPI000DA9E747|nr:sugar nucleotide-binding protein [Mesonia sp. K7]PZD79264.1 dTDP-4-dehydrorhamnose reductase [Mesonia sp. K7]
MANRILILGGSGFIGNALYKELLPYFEVHATFCQDNQIYEKNQQFHQWDAERENISILLEQLKPNVIITAIRCDFDAELFAMQQIIKYVKKRTSKIIYFSSANVFDAFTNYPSYEYDKTFSTSNYGKFKIKIENALLSLSDEKYVLVRLPMVFGNNSPRFQEITSSYEAKSAIEVFPNVVMNFCDISRLTQQIHYIINRAKSGIFHLGSNDLTHHKDFIYEICRKFDLNHVIFKNVFDANEDRYIALLPKYNKLPKNLQYTVQEIIDDLIV